MLKQKGVFTLAALSREDALKKSKSEKMKGTPGRRGTCRQTENPQPGVV